MKRRREVDDFKQRAAQSPAFGGRDINLSSQTRDIILIYNNCFLIQNLFWGNLIGKYLA